MKEDRLDIMVSTHEEPRRYRFKVSREVQTVREYAVPRPPFEQGFQMFNERGGGVGRSRIYDAGRYAFDVIEEPSQSGVLVGNREDLNAREPGHVRELRMPIGSRGGTANETKSGDIVIHRELLQQMIGATLGPGIWWKRKCLGKEEELWPGAHASCLAPVDEATET